MDASNSEYIVVFIASYLLTALTLLAYKAGLNDLFVRTRKQIFRELRAVHPTALLSGFVSLIPLAVVRHQEDTTQTTYAVIGGVVVYFLATLAYRKLHGLKLMDFSIDNGSNFNDEVSADPTVMQRLWLFLVSWAGALSMGTVFGFVISYETWRENAGWLSDQPADTEARVYLYVFAGFLVASTLVMMFLRNRRLRKLPTSGRVRRAVNRAWVVPAIFGLMFAALMDFTRNTTLTNRYWVIFLFVVMALVSLWNLVFVAPNVLRHFTEEKKFFEERQKRMRRQRNKKRKKNRR